MDIINVTIFGIHLTLKPIAFTIPIAGGWDVYWYGIIIALGFLLALFYGIKNAERLNINTDRLLDAVIVVVPVSILCARAYYVIFDGEPIHSIKDFFGFSGSSGFSGIAIYGGVIGAFVSGALMCKLRKLNIPDTFDLTAIGFLIGQGIGRWGNFVNQEAYGTFTNSSFWGMQSDRTIAEMGEGLVHPCFLYESIWCLTGFLILHHFSKKRKFSGQIFLMYCIWYGFGRGFIELLRTDSLGVNIRVSSLLSFVLCITASVLLIYFLRKIKINSSNENYIKVFASEEDSEKNETENTESNSIAEDHEDEQNN